MIDTLLLTGGNGDCIKVLSFVVPRKVLYAGQERGKIIGTLCRQLGIEFEQLAVPNKVYYQKCEVEAAYGRIDNVVDGSIANMFHRLGKEFDLLFQGNPLLNLNLPRVIKEDYCLCVPCSENFGVNRDLTQQEMACVIKQNTKVVVMHQGRLKHSLPPGVVNMVNKTNILEAIGLVQHASNYMGIDSWAACLFSELGRPMTIKSVSPNWYRWFDVYTANKFGNTEFIKSVPRIG